MAARNYNIFDASPVTNDNMAARNYNIFDEPIPVCLMTRSNHKCKKYSTDNCTSDSDCELITCSEIGESGLKSYQTCVSKEEQEQCSSE